VATDQPVGTLAEEAAKLFSALQGWAAEHRGPDHGEPDDSDRPNGSDSDGSAAYVDAHESGQHLSAECRYCPLCNLARFARAASPEVREHLTSAALSMTLAVKGLLEGVDRQRPEPRHDAVEKIDLMED
jgi:hypothetical protein